MWAENKLVQGWVPPALERIGVSQQVLPWSLGHWRTEFRADPCFWGEKHPCVQNTDGQPTFWRWLEDLFGQTEELAGSLAPVSGQNHCFRPQMVARRWRIWLLPTLGPSAWSSPDRTLRPFRAPQADPEQMPRVLPGVHVHSILATGVRGLLRAAFKSQDPAVWWYKARFPAHSGDLVWIL